GVHAHRALAAHEIEARAQRRLSAEVRSQAAQAYPPVAGRSVANDLAARVDGIVVDEDDLERDAARLDDTYEPIDQLRQRRGIVVDWDDDRQIEGAHHFAPDSPPSNRRWNVAVERR